MDDKLWVEFLGGPNAGLCGLCGQSGIIDTLGHVYSPAGFHCGVIAYCICPNGRAMKKEGWPDVYTAAASRRRSPVRGG